MASEGNSSEGTVESISVVIRIRPLNTRERGEDLALDIDEENSRIEAIEKDKKSNVGAAENNRANPSWKFDRVFGLNTQQGKFYDDVARSRVATTFDGFNATIFAYGQTGSGKTYTMEGAWDNPGIIPRAISQIFDTIVQITSRNPESMFLVRVSYLEVYMDEVKDLLGNDGKELKIREDTSNGLFFAKGLTEEVVGSAEDVAALLQKGVSRRTSGATNMNEHSSRSHAIFTFWIERQHAAKEEEALTGAKKEQGQVTVGKLNLVDLAGSERVAKTGATGVRAKQGQAINKSLTQLSIVIKALVDREADKRLGKKTHVPYRDSVLTRLLSDSLGGNSKTLMIAACSPAESNKEETISTLRFAAQVKSVKNKPKVNEDAKDAQLREMTEEIARLRAISGGGSGSGGASFKNEDAAAKMLQMVVRLALEKSRAKKQEKSFADAEAALMLGKELEKSEMEEKVADLENENRDLMKKLSIADSVNDDRLKVAAEEARLAAIEESEKEIRRIKEDVAKEIASAEERARKEADEIPRQKIAELETALKASQEDAKQRAEAEKETYYKATQEYEANLFKTKENSAKELEAAKQQAEKAIKEAEDARKSKTDLEAEVKAKEQANQEEAKLRIEAEKAVQEYETKMSEAKENSAKELEAAKQQAEATRKECDEAHHKNVELEAALQLKEDAYQEEVRLREEVRQKAAEEYEKMKSMESGANKDMAQAMQQAEAARQEADDVRKRNGDLEAALLAKEHTHQEEAKLKEETYHKATQEYEAKLSEAKENSAKELEAAKQQAEKAIKEAEDARKSKADLEAEVKAKEQANQEEANLRSEAEEEHRKYKLEVTSSLDAVKKELETAKQEREAARKDADDVRKSKIELSGVLQTTQADLQEAKANTNRLLADQQEKLTTKLAARHNLLVSELEAEKDKVETELEDARDRCEKYIAARADDAFRFNQLRDMAANQRQRDQRTIDMLNKDLADLQLEVARLNGRANDLLSRKKMRRLMVNSILNRLVGRILRKALHKWAALADYIPKIFPEQFGPFEMKPAIVEGLSLTINTGTCMYEVSFDSAPLADIPVRYGECVLNVGQLSPPHPITLSPQRRSYARIPPAATHMIWAYPLTGMAAVGQTTLDVDPALLFATFGGYVYCEEKNGEMNVVSTSAIATSAFQTGKDVYFCPPITWRPSFTKALSTAGRFQRMNIDTLEESGAKYYCWIHAGEVLVADDPLVADWEISTHGGFAYLFDEPGKPHPLDRFFGIWGGTGDGDEFLQLTATAESPRVLDRLSGQAAESTDDSWEDDFSVLPPPPPPFKTLPRSVSAGSLTRNDYHTDVEKVQISKDGPLGMSITRSGTSGMLIAVSVAAGGMAHSLGIQDGTALVDVDGGTLDPNLSGADFATILGFQPRPFNLGIRKPLNTLQGVTKAQEGFRHGAGGGGR
jgi:kinesin family protein 3/17